MITKTMIFVNRKVAKSGPSRINTQIKKQVGKTLSKTVATAKTIKKRVKNNIRRLRRNMRNPIVSRNRAGFNVSTGVRNPTMVKGPPVTEAGIAFLKCAFAPPDFTSTQVKGIPDTFRGNSLLKKHRYNASTSFTSANDYYFLLLPIPGVSYCVATTAPGVLPTAATVWNTVYYSDFTQLFGANQAQSADVVSAFRFVSNHFELVPTVNQMTWSGSISAWKMPIKVTIGANYATGFVRDYTITGLQGVTSTNSNRYVGQFNDGLFSGCFSSAPEFDFMEILESVQAIPTSLDTGDFGQIQSSNSIPGFDNGFESMVIKVAGVTANQTAILRTWACVEYTPAANSALYEYSTTSPPEDVTALKLYREIALGIPVGVPYRENSDFWKRVLGIIRTITGATSMIPGPYGAISGGINAITGGISDLFL